MAEREVLDRIDAHMARGNELLEEVREEMRLSREERELSRELFGDMRDFMSEVTVRVERVAREQIAELRKLGRGFEAVTEELRDMRGETRAQTRAILRVLDKLDGGSANATA
jgi:hypothetical protein